MAKDGHDREDLLNDATGYSQRIELELKDVDETVFCGFRECGALSVYWSQENVLQFNAAKELRRAFWQDRMIASYRGEPNWLDKSAGRVRLNRTTLTNDERERFTSLAKSWLQTLSDGIAREQIVSLEVMPPEVDVLSTVRCWLDEFDHNIRFALHPGLAKNKPKR